MQPEPTKPTRFIDTISTRFVTVFPSWFWSVLGLCVLHRLIAMREFFQSSFIPTYNPSGGRMGGLRLWAEILGESTLLGLTYDVLFAALLAGLLVLVPRILRFVVLVALALFLAANIDHIEYNHSNISFSTAHLGADTTFIRGMLSTELALHAAVLLLLGMFVLLVLRVHLLRKIMGVVSLAVIALAAFLPVQGSFAHPLWLQSNPLLGAPLDGASDIDNRAFSADVFERRLTSGDVTPKFNVLLVYMEGLSHHSIELGDMETLSGLAERNIDFSRYIGPQLLTANGLFSSLTGNLPYFTRGDLKWLDTTDGSETVRDALPWVLRDSGYHTAFLQSANLEFMSKGDVMPRLGFETVQGRSSWDRFYSEDGWGIDDRALFEHTLDYIDTLEPENPWFVSILTTGTHAAYNMPREYLPEEPSRRYRALRYLDDAVKELTDGLAERGLLDNTIVVLTSDESRERSVEGQLQSELALNWLPLIVMHPSRTTARVENYVSAVQLPELIMDMQREDFPGDLATAPQSVEPLVFGNVYSGRFYWFEPEQDVLLVCMVKNFVCAQFDGMDDPMMAADRVPDKVARYPLLEQSVFAEEPAE